MTTPLKRREKWTRARSMAEARGQTSELLFSSLPLHFRSESIAEQDTGQRDDDALEAKGEVDEGAEHGGGQRPDVGITLLLPCPSIPRKAIVARRSPPRGRWP